VIRGQLLRLLATLIWPAVDMHDGGVWEVYGSMGLCECRVLSCR